MENIWEATLQSVFHLLIKNYEIILIDDSSEDNSYTILNNMKMKNENVFCFSQPNGGPFRCRKQCDTSGKREYILPVDAMI